MSALPHPINTAFEAVHSYNEAPERREESGAFMVHAMHVLTAKDELEKAGVDSGEVQKSVSAVEGAAMDEDKRTIADFAQLELGQALGAVGLSARSAGFGYMAPAFESPERFTQALAETPHDTVSAVAAQEIDTLFTMELQNACLVGAARDINELLRRYPQTTEVLEAYPELLSIDATNLERQRTLFENAEHYAPQLGRLGVAQATMDTIQAVVAAERDGVLPEYSLLHMMGAFETNQRDVNNSFVGSWYEAEQWQPLDTVMHGLRQNHPRAAYSSLGHLLPRTIEKLINPDVIEPEPLSAEDRELLEDVGAFDIPEPTAEELAEQAAYVQFLRERQIAYGLL